LDNRLTFMPATINGTSGFGGNLTGNVTGNADTSTAAVTADKLTTTTGSAPVYACRAWVNFNGTTGSTIDGEFRCTIRASGNVTKVVRNSTGDYTVTFTTALPPDYAIAGVGSSNPESATNALKGIMRSTYSTTSCRIVNATDGNTANNYSEISVIFIA